MTLILWHKRLFCKTILKKYYVETIFFNRIYCNILYFVIPDIS